MPKPRLRIAIIVVLVVALIFLFALAMRPGDIGPALPNPNGYDTIMAAAKLAPAIEANSTNKSILTNHLETLRAARVGLSQESRARLPRNLDDVPAHVESLGGIKALANLYQLEGRAAEEDGDFKRAAESYLDVVRLAHASSRGGLLISRMLAISVERSGLDRLRALRPKLSVEEAIYAAEALSQIDRRSETADETIATERRWSAKAGGWRMSVARIVKPGLMRGPEVSLQKKVAEIEKLRREMIALYGSSEAAAERK